MLLEIRTIVSEFLRGTGSLEIRVGSENCSIWCGQLEFALEQFNFNFNFARQIE
jgi:hypothetical protein